MRFRTNVSRALMQLASVVMFGAATAHAAPMTAKEATRPRRRGVHLRLSAGDDGIHAPRDRRTSRNRKAPGLPWASSRRLRDVSECVVQRRHGAERRHALHRAWIDVGEGAWVVLSMPDDDRIAITSSRCSTAGPTCSRCPASARPAPARRRMRSPVPAGRATLPAGVTEYKSPTAIVWLLGRIYCTGTPEDYAAVHALQDQVSIVPLSAYGKPYTPPRR